MLTKFSLYNKSETSQWDRFVASHPNGSPYHLSCWMRTIHETYSFKPLLYVHKNGTGDISGVFPCFVIKSHLTGSRIVSLPFSDYCGPLFTDIRQQKEVLSEIIKNYGQQVKYIEIRSPVSEDSGLVCHKYYKHHVLNLDADPSEIRRRLNKRTIQYSIRKAKKAGVEIREENTLRGMEEFCRLNMLTRKKHGVPSQPRRFFQNMYDYMMLTEHAFILLAIYDSKPVAASVFFRSNGTVHYKYNASDPRYLSRTTPNHLLTWHAIEKACLEGYRFFDFGRTSPDNAGLMRYKEMFGAKRVNLPYYYYPQIKGASSKEESSLLYRMLTGIWRSLPDPILEKIGPMIYKHTA